MLDAQPITITIRRDWQALYERIWRPEVFPLWAEGLSGHTLVPDGQAWTTEGPSGTVRITFTPWNAYGIMDHWVEPREGTIIYVPLRIVANEDGAEVTLILFRQPGMSDATFAADAVQVRRDLASLKALAES